MVFQVLQQRCEFDSCFWEGGLSNRFGLHPGGSAHWMPGLLVLSATTKISLESLHGVYSQWPGISSGGIQAVRCEVCKRGQLR
jgi:hypothetical protein